MSERQDGKSEKTGRIFSQKELKNFSKGFMQLAVEAIDAGDLEAARRWCRREAETHSQIHDLLVNTVAGMASYIYDKLGEESAVTAIRDIMGIGLQPELIALRKDPKKWILWCVDMWRQHSADPGLTVEEDDEKFTLTVKCGSGAKLVEMRAYEGPKAYRKIKKAAPHTWGETNVPIYCGHCPWVHEILPIRMAGQGSQFWVHGSPFPKKPGDPCIHYVYKNPADIPEKYYKRLGMKKKVK